MTPLLRSVPQRRRRNLSISFEAAATIVLVSWLFLMPLGLIADAIVTSNHGTSRLQPALDQIQRFGERKCWSGEVGR